MGTPGHRNPDWAAGPVFSPAVPHSEKAEQSAGTDHWLWMCHDPCPGNGLEPDAEFWVGLYVHGRASLFYVWRIPHNGCLGPAWNPAQYLPLSGFDLGKKSGKGGLQCTGPIGEIQNPHRKNGCMMNCELLKNSFDMSG